MVDRYDELYRSFRWRVPERYNIAQACCGQWAGDRGRFALYWEDESGAMAAYSFWDIQQAANRLSNALAGLGVRKGERVALCLPRVSIRRAPVPIQVVPCAAVNRPRSRTAIRRGCRFRRCGRLAAQ